MIYETFSVHCYRFRIGAITALHSLPDTVNVDHYEAANFRCQFDIIPHEKAAEEISKIPYQTSAAMGRINKILESVILIANPNVSAIKCIHTKVIL